MRIRFLYRLAILGFFLPTTFIAKLSPGQDREEKGISSPLIPKTYDEAEVKSWNLPLACAKATPSYMPAKYFDSIRVRPVFKTYPVYHPDKEPPGYWEWLQRQLPEVIWDDKGKCPPLKTRSDWIKAGELAYEIPIERIDHEKVLRLRNEGVLKSLGTPIARDGTAPFFHYVVPRKGKVELGIFTCGTCHTRVQPDGGILKATQGNFPIARFYAWMLRAGLRGAGAEPGRSRYEYYGSPWLKDDPNASLKTMSAEQIALAYEMIPPGVFPNHNGSPFWPVKTANLIGVKDRRYLDSTGHMRHRGPSDLMRFADFNQRDSFYPNFGPYKVREAPRPTDPDQERYSDEQVYAMALFIYSLQPPPNPNKFDALARRGKEIFEREECARCHTPPLYTNNMLTPVDGFTVPEDHPEMDNIMRQSVHTDSTLALKTRKGTGFYKVPSLRGLWYLGPFEHNGSCATLEDWFDPRRLNDDYVPTGFRGYKVERRAVPGHEFGLDLDEDEKRSLIAYLKTL